MQYKTHLTSIRYIMVPIIVVNLSKFLIITIWTVLKDACRLRFRIASSDAKGFCRRLSAEQSRQAGKIYEFFGLNYSLLDIYT